MNYKKPPKVNKETETITEEEFKKKRKQLPRRLRSYLNKKVK